MDKQEHKGARLISDDLISITPDIQICFPPELGMKNRNIWGEVICEKYHIMTVKEWLKHKKERINITETISEGVFVPRDGIASRYAVEKVNPGFYGFVKFEAKFEVKKTE